ncbi:TIGR03085 family metal-binding protein [Lentzea sp. DG1S-22]|uniref:TIGR03085 family metal-binding protein n=1 Tax=Lentzea sp. DG1S-22 TaxID=3108822 RepID=UPI002E75FD3A|nr:TIGR03085 family metal-binding protein [Lentzea sp. DG1S-22]WVH80379.1 TIGR03085 family metal-binding protein [Lentzea sp. DG1S-22]
MSLARDERKALVDLMTELGPDAPTLCDPWRTLDLAAHLAIRERRPDTAPGIVLPVFASWTGKVQEDYKHKAWSELLDLVRTPPFWIKPIDDLMNTAEYFVHHEDVRRAQAGWEPRPYDARREATLWKVLPLTARMTYKSSPVGVTLVRPDGEHVVAKQGANGVVITGEVPELVMLAFGRDQVRVEYSGDPDSVQRVRSLNRSV